MVKTILVIIKKTAICLLIGGVFGTAIGSIITTSLSINAENRFNELIEKIERLEKNKIERNNLDLSPNQLQQLKEIIEKKSNKVISISYPKQPVLSKTGLTLLMYSEDTNLTRLEAKKLGSTLNGLSNDNVLKIRNVEQNKKSIEFSPIAFQLTIDKIRYFKKRYSEYENIIYFRKNKLDTSIIDIIFYNPKANLFTVSLGKEQDILEPLFYKQFSQYHLENIIERYEKRNKESFLGSAKIIHNQISKINLIKGYEVPKYFEYY